MIPFKYKHKLEGRYSMDIKKNIGSVEKVCLTVLVDNKADLIVESSEQVKYFTDIPLLAEHGFSVLIQPDNSEEKVLWDAGVSKVALIENIRRMELDRFSSRVGSSM